MLAHILNKIWQHLPKSVHDTIWLKNTTLSHCWGWTCGRNFSKPCVVVGPIEYYTQLKFWISTVRRGHVIGDVSLPALFRFPFSDCNIYIQLPNHYRLLHPRPPLAHCPCHQCVHWAPPEEHLLGLRQWCWLASQSAWWWKRTWENHDEQAVNVEVETYEARAYILWRILATTSGFMSFHCCADTKCFL